MSDEADYVPLRPFERPQGDEVVRHCGARLQHHNGKPLPCASCWTGQRRYVVVEQMAPAANPFSAAKIPDPKAPAAVEILYSRREYLDSHFPNRRAAFWWREYPPPSSALFGKADSETPLGDVMGT